MSPEEREMMHFILQCQSEAAADHRAAMESLREMKERQEESRRQQEKQHERTSAKIDRLVAVTHDLVKVARMHSRRLDRLDGL